jgi:hypothetical protein
MAGSFLIRRLAMSEPFHKYSSPDPDGWGKQIGRFSSFEYRPKDHFLIERVSLAVIVPEWIDDDDVDEYIVSVETKIPDHVIGDRDLERSRHRITKVIPGDTDSTEVAQFLINECSVPVSVVNQNYLSPIKTGGGDSGEQ